MKNYEITFIVDPVLSGEEIKATAQTYVDHLKKEGCTIVHVDEMGLKQLAYPINRRTSGVYYCVEFSTPTGELINKMEQITASHTKVCLQVCHSPFEKPAIALVLHIVSGGAIWGLVGACFTSLWGMPRIVSTCSTVESNLCLETSIGCFLSFWPIRIALSIFHLGFIEKSWVSAAVNGSTSHLTSTVKYGSYEGLSMGKSRIDWQKKNGQRFHSRSFRPQNP